MPLGGSLSPKHCLEIGSQATVGIWKNTFAKYFTTNATEMDLSCGGTDTYRLFSEKVIALKPKWLAMEDLQTARASSSPF